MKRLSKKLSINKSTLSNLDANSINGGDVKSALSNCEFCATWACVTKKGDSVKIACCLPATKAGVSTCTITA